MFGGLQFAIPMLVVTCGTLAVGIISALLEGHRLVGQRERIGGRIQILLCLFNFPHQRPTSFESLRSRCGSCWKIRCFAEAGLLLVKSRN